MRRPCASHPGRGRPGHGRGAARRPGPGPMTPSRAAWYFHSRTPSLFFPSLPRRRPHRSKRDRAHSFSHLHSSPTPPLERPSLPIAPRTQTAASGHRQPTLPRGFRPSTAAVCHSPVSSSPSYQSLQFLAIFSPPCLSGAVGPHTAVATHRSPLPADECCCPTPFAPPHRRPAIPVRPCPLLLARHLPRDPLEISGNTLSPSSHRRATGEGPTALSRVQSARDDRADSRAARALQQATHTGCPTGLGCQAVAQPAFRPTAHGRSTRPMGYSLGPVSGPVLCRRF
jgi:hypothetical protein